jgi:hypothetical protein
MLNGYVLICLQHILCILFILFALEWNWYLIKHVICLNTLSDSLAQYWSCVVLRFGSHYTVGISELSDQDQTV